ncbi:hypothetical protein ABGN05_26975 [Aquibium sp. LZ166]|uniref:Uncharacterized protein n=1 Tax=Aquibium pacificus TaxID=3153579 RepID=A0ABV3SR59_9HYPH
MESKVHEAKIKLTSDTVNRLAISCVVVGVITPVAGALLGIASVPVSVFAFATGSFFIAGVLLHLWARRILDRLSE